MNLRTFAIFCMTLVLPTAATAQDHKCGCCTKGAHSDHGSGPPPSGAVTGEPHASASLAPPEYNAAYEGLITGVIHSVMSHEGMDVQLTIGVGEKTYEILVAPRAWLEHQKAVFRTGERVTVVGARSDRGSGEAFVAREIQTDGQTVVVRDAEGRPLWNQE